MSRANEKEELWWSNRSRAASASSSSANDDRAILDRWISLLDDEAGFLGGATSSTSAAAAAVKEVSEKGHRHQLQSSEHLGAQSEMDNQVGDEYRKVKWNALLVQLHSTDKKLELEAMEGLLIMAEEDDETELNSLRKPCPSSSSAASANKGDIPSGVIWTLTKPNSLRGEEQFAVVLHDQISRRRQTPPKNQHITNLMNVKLK